MPPLFDIVGLTAVHWIIGILQKHERTRGVDFFTLSLCCQGLTGGKGVSIRPAA